MVAIGHPRNPFRAFLLRRLRKRFSTMLHFSGTAGSRSILPVRRDVGNYSLGESLFLNLTRHRAQIDQQTVHFRHPYKWIAADQAGKRPLRVKYPRLEGLLNDARLGVEGALPDAECGAQVCRCHVRKKRSVTEKIDPSQHVDDPTRPGSRLSGSEWARALPAQRSGHCARQVS